MINSSEGQKKRLMGETMEIQFQNISKRYKNKLALNQVTTRLTPGIYGLLGANGAGKTTLINILVGILACSGGNIFVDGTDVQKLGKQFLKEIGYLPQYPQFYRDFTVQKFLSYMCALKDIPRATAQQRIVDLLQAVNLRDAGKMKIGALSGGMRQRVGIVQALLGDPKLLILDEPTAGLDPQERIRFRTLITQFSENRIVLLATHIVSDVDAIANKVLILKEGMLIRQDTPEHLCEELTGKIWEVSLNAEQALSDFDQYPISKLQRNGMQLHIRVLADAKPVQNAIAVNANLEDVFLYHFGQSESAY